MLTSLAACREGAVRTETVEVKVPVYVALDPRLTALEPLPARPQDRCVDTLGRATICNRDHAEWTNAYDAALRRINARMAEIAGLQP